VNMKGMQEEFNLFPAGTRSSVHGAITSSHSSNVSATLPALKPKQPLTIFKLCYVPWNGKREADGRAGRIRQSIPLAALLGRAIWDEEQMCAEVRLCSRASDDGAGILAVDETSFLKRGEESVGVGRQYCGLTGQKRTVKLECFSRRSSARRGRA